jgi:ribonuclease E
MGTIRSVESMALALLRLIGEEARKERTAKVIAMLPVDVATYLINEKRDWLRSIEEKNNTEVILIPNKYMETPAYDIRRVRDDEVNLAENSGASHQMALPPPVPDDVAGRDKRTPAPTPAVTTIIPTMPAPPSIAQETSLAPAPTEQVGIFVKLWRFLFGGAFRGRTAEAAPTSRDRHEARRQHSRDRSRGRDRGREEEQNRERDRARARADRPEPKREATGTESRQPGEQRREQQAGSQQANQQRAPRPQSDAAAASAAPRSAGEAAATANDPSRQERGERRGRRRRRRGGRGRVEGEHSVATGHQAASSSSGASASAQPSSGAQPTTEGTPDTAGWKPRPVSDESRPSTEPRNDTPSSPSPAAAPVPVTVASPPAHHEESKTHTVWSSEPSSGAV